MNDLKKSFALMTTVALVVFQFAFAQVSSASSAGVVINEVAWAGSSDDSGDEWIELYNASSSAVDLNGWTLEDDGAVVVTFEDVELGPYEYFLIEDAEDVTDMPSNLLAGLSLANSGDELVLKDANGAAVDSVAEWFAGDGDDKASMERVNPEEDGADAWATALYGNGAVASGGSQILGTPGSINSTYDGPGAKVEMTSVDLDSFSVEVTGAEDLYAYGFDINHGALWLSFLGGSEGEFLK